eukprot:1015242-Rhodomonas_salina.1
MQQVRKRGFEIALKWGFDGAAGGFGGGGRQDRGRGRPGTKPAHVVPFWAFDMLRSVQRLLLVLTEAMLLPVLTGDMLPPEVTKAMLLSVLTVTADSTDRGYVPTSTDRGYAPTITDIGTRAGAGGVAAGGGEERA